MKLIDVYAQLKALGLPTLQTREAAGCLNVTNAHASQMLLRLSKSGHLLHLRQGVWGFPERLDRLALPMYLTAPMPSYVSLQTALYYHGMISQIPSVTYAVSLARSRSFDTPLGRVSIHHVQPGFFFGYEGYGKHEINMATPEKALLDVFYLGFTKTGLFGKLPELTLPDNFNLKLAYEMIERVQAPQIKTRMVAGLMEVRANSR